MVARAVYRHLSSEAKPALTEALEESISRRESQLNSFVVDLEDSAPDSALKRLGNSAPETFGTAQRLLLSNYCGSDGFCVRVNRGLCAPDEYLPTGRERERARFLAWPYAHARIVRAEGKPLRQQMATELRKRTRVALVLDAAPSSDEAEAKTMNLVERRELLRRTANSITESAVFDIPWSPEVDELLVVPTLSAVADAVDEEQLNATTTKPYPRGPH